MSVRSSETFAFSNAGPLTTAWALPSSCTSFGSMVTGVARPGLPGVAAFLFNACTYDDMNRDCWPNDYNTLNLDPFHVNTIQYHSPGLACPSAWATAGVVSKENGTIDASGVFASTVFQYLYYINDSTPSTLPLPINNFANNAWTAVLEPTETAIACCPR